MSHLHDSTGNCDGAVWSPEPRCTRTTHRIAWGGIEPRQTREYLRSPWTAPLAVFELAGRAEAWWRGVLHRTGRLPL
jgi:hypothetical protein